MNGVGKHNPWLSIYRPQPSASLRLFCFPYAGGTSLIYRSWAESLPPQVEVCPVQLPGRGERLRERPYTRVGPLVEAVAGNLVTHLDKPFAFFGHSMGAIIAFELARHLRRTRGLQPAHLFISGRRAPQLPESDRITYNLPEAELIEELRLLSGTPPEVLAHPELMRLMLPVLRADFELLQTWEYRPEPPLDCPITVCGGLEDREVSREKLSAWREQTTKAFNLRMFSGDHFFLHTARPQLLQMLAAELGRTR